MARQVSSHGISSVLAIAAVVLLAAFATWFSTRPSDSLRDADGEHGSALAPLVAGGAPREELRGSPSGVTRSTEAGGAAEGALQAPDSELDLHGLVVDSEHRGIANALVAAIDYPWRRLTVLEGQREARTLAEARTASDGSFRLRLARGACVALRAEAEGCARREISECQAGERIVVVLPRGVALDVVARDEAGDVVKKASVSFSRNDDAGIRDSRSGVTDAEGCCRFDALEAGYGWVQCHHDVLGSSGGKQVELGSEDVTRFEVVLPVGRALRGRVIDAETKLPIAGARVGESWVLHRGATTQSDGSYELRGWTQSGVDALHAVAEGYGRLALKIPAEGPIDFELRKGDAARGRVLSAAGVAIGGALVTAVASQHTFRGRESDSQMDKCSTTTSDEGRFELESLRRDLPHTLVVLAEGHGRLLLDFDPAPQAAGTIELGDLVLPPARSISGVALEADGRPLARARILLVGHNADRKRLRIHTEELAQTMYGNTQERRTDDRGRFRFPDLSPGSYHFELELAGAPEVVRNLELSAEHDLEGVELRLPAGKSLTVRVVSELLVPIVGVSVTMHSEAGAQAGARTSAEGVCTFRALPASEFRLSVLPFPDYLRPPAQTVVPADQEVRFVLRRLAQLKGSVVDASGAKLPHVEIEAVPSEGEAQKGACDEKGDFAVRVAHGERYLLRLTGRRRMNFGGGGFGTERTRWRGELANVYAPAQDLVVRAAEIEATGSLDVRVEDADGQPFENAEVFLQGGGPNTSKKSDAAGRVHFENLMEGKLLVHAEPPPDPARTWVNSDQIELESGTQEVLLRLRRSQTIEGVVLRPNGEPAAGVKVSIRGGDVLYAFTKTDDQGRFRSIVEPAEQYWIEAELSRPGEPLLRGKSEPFAPGVGPHTVQLRP